MERFGFVGLPNAGKSSLYNALAGGGALAAPYAFATRDPNVGVAKVLDGRLDALAAMSASRNVVPASVQFVDIGGLVEGASKGEGLGNRFLANIREADAVVYVLRAFEDADVPGPSDPLEHLRVVELELTLADLEAVENQVAKRRKAAKADKSLADEVAALDAAEAVLSEGTPALPQRPRPRACGRCCGPTSCSRTGRCSPSSTSARTSSTTSPRSSSRSRTSWPAGPRCWACACSSRPRRPSSTPGGAGRDARGAGPRRGGAGRGSSTPPTTCSACARSSPPARRSRGPGRSGPAGRRPQCAGVIHTDFEKGFIRAEVIHWDELIDLGSWSKARDVGKLRVEGKDYEVADGDVMEIRFNV